jgi:hypothetical protein
MAIKTFTTGEVLTTSDTNTYLANAGLDYIGATTLSAVSNNVTNVFSATYDSYRVVISDFYSATSTARVIGVRLLSGTTPDTSSNYEYVYQLTYTPNIGGVTATTGNFWEIAASSTRRGQSIAIDFHSPFKTHASSIIFQALTYQNNLPGYIIRQGGGGHNVATSYNGFQIYGVTDVLAGTVRVYGYRQA